MFFLFREKYLRIRILESFLILTSYFLILYCLNENLVHAGQLLDDAGKGVMLIEVSNGIVQGGTFGKLYEGALNVVAWDYIIEIRLWFHRLLSSHVNHKEILLVLLLNVVHLAFKHYTGMVDERDLLANFLNTCHVVG